MKKLFLGGTAHGKVLEVETALGQLPPSWRLPKPEWQFSVFDHDLYELDATDNIDEYVLNFNAFYVSNVPNFNKTIRVSFYMLRETEVEEYLDTLNSKLLNTGLF